MKYVKKIKRRVHYELDHIFRIGYHTYKYMSDEKCVRKIAKVARNEALLQGSSLQVTNQVDNLIMEAADNSVTIVLEYQFGPRHIKLIRGLKNAGVKVKLVLYSAWAQSVAYDELIRMVDEYRIYCNTLELMYHIIDFNSYIVHYCTAWGECDRVASLLCHKKLFPTIVVERYDILSEMYSENYGRYTKQDARMERIAFELADAICAREYTLDYLRNEKGYHISAKDIVFLDYVE